MAMGEEAQGGLTGAMTGAAMGAAVGGAPGAIIGGGVGLLGGAMGGKGARKARRAAMAAAAAQRKAIGQYGRFQGDLANRIDAALNDPQEMALLTQTMSAAERDLGRQERMLAAMDPAVKEAAMQAHALLKGEEASSLAPLRAERQRQRQTLLNTLRAQLGPGAENSSAGQQALNRFDAETSNVMASQQQSSLNSLFNMADRGTQYNLSQAIGTAGAAAGLRSGRAMQGIGARADLMAPIFQAKIQTAGGGQIGNMMQGQYQNQLGGQLLGAMTSLASLSAGKSFSNPFSGMFGGGSEVSGGGNAMGGSGTPGNQRISNDL